MRKPVKPLRRIVVVEDHPEFRDALCQALSQSPELQQLETCKDLPAGMQLLERDCPDILLVDLGLPSGSGLTLIRVAQQRWGASCTSAVLTVTGNDEHLLTAVAAGAKGYLFKSDQAATWLQTVNILAAGQSPLHSNLARCFLQLSASPNLKKDDCSQCTTGDIKTRQLLQYIAAGYTCAETAAIMELREADVGVRVRSVYDQFCQPSPGLTVRELELLQLLNKGFGFKKCAELMGVSEATTKTLAGRAYQKLGAANLQAALYEARAASLIA